MVQKATLAVERAGEIFELTQGETLRPGDKIINKGTEAATVGTLSKTSDYPSTLATLKPGQAVKVTDVGQPEDEVLGLEALDGEVAIEQASAEAVAASDFLVTPEVEVLEEAQGLFGVVPFLGGAGGIAALAGAIGLATLGGDDGDGDSGGDNTNGGGGSAITGAGGLVGGVEQLNSGLSQTPLEPLTAVTTPLRDGLGMVGDALLNADEPTGLAVVLGEVIGAPGSGSGQPGDGGLVGVLNAVSTGLNDAVGSEGLEPLAPVVTPLTQTLGATNGVTDGVGQGLANVGTTLSNDSSPLGPLTADVLGPVVGTSTGQNDGLPQTLEQTGEGLTDLTNPDSALAPLSALTGPLSDSVVQPLADGVEQAGNALADAAGQDPTGTVALLADLLGGDAAAADAGGTGDPLGALTGLLGGGLPTGALPTGGLPTDALPIDAITGLLGGGLPTGALPTGGLPTDALTDLLGGAGGLPGISTGAGLPGLDTLTNALPV